MSSLFVRCPTTHEPVSTGIETDPESLAKMQSTTVSIVCPHCGQLHDLKMSETYMVSKDNLIRFPQAKINRVSLAPKK
jgi:hypothetical protein